MHFATRLTVSIMLRDFTVKSLVDSVDFAGILRYHFRSSAPVDEHARSDRRISR
jgi:hypothetical protein